MLPIMSMNDDSNQALCLTACLRAGIMAKFEKTRNSLWISSSLTQQKITGNRANNAVTMRVFCIVGECQKYNTQFWHVIHLFIFLFACPWEKSASMSFLAIISS